VSTQRDGFGRGGGTELAGRQAGEPLDRAIPPGSRQASGPLDRATGTPVNPAAGGAQPGTPIDTVVIGGGQAGLSTAYFLRKFGIEYVVLDHSPAAGGAWQFRWPSLTLSTAHRVHDLPGMPLGEQDTSRPAAEVVSEYFARYERTFQLNVRRPVHVAAVRDSGDRLVVESSAEVWLAHTVVNATGTWDKPFVPYYPGRETFRGWQLHSSAYPGADAFAGKHVVVVGGGASATQQLAEISQVTTTTWVTRRPPEFRAAGAFTEEWGRRVEAAVAANTARGGPPRSVVSYTGLGLTPEVEAARKRGALDRLPMFDRITPDGVAWDDGRFVRADVILWATGFRPAVDHLAPLKLREPAGGIAVVNTRAVREPRLFLVGYGPSASTIGAARAGRVAATGVRDLLTAKDLQVA
jgi:thioredoxin reductase